MGLFVNQRHGLTLVQPKDLLFLRSSEAIGFIARGPHGGVTLYLLCLFTLLFSDGVSVMRMLMLVERHNLFMRTEYSKVIMARPKGLRKLWYAESYFAAQSERTCRSQVLDRFRRIPQYLSFPASVWQ